MGKGLTIDYTNWRGERAERRVLPGNIYFGRTEWHPKDQWLLSAVDEDRGAERLFALADIHSWKQAKTLSHEKRDLKAHRDSLAPEHRGLFDLLMEFPLGRFLLEHGGLNGYWTDYVIRGGDPKTDLEKAMLGAPTALATQERFQHFKRVIQEELKPGMTAASVPCGLMGDLLDLDVEDVSFVGIDLDLESVIHASKKAGQNTTFFLCDAWELNVSEEYDVLTSNGLNIYEPDDEHCKKLYKNFYNALKPGGLLVTSILTPPTEASEELLLQKTLFIDVIKAGWSTFRTKEATEAQLVDVGFTDIRFIDDREGLFPTVTARRL